MVKWVTKVLEQIYEAMLLCYLVVTYLYMNPIHATSIKKLFTRPPFCKMCYYWKTLHRGSVTIVLQRKSVVVYGGLQFNAYSLNQPCTYESLGLNISTLQIIWSANYINRMGNQGGKVKQWNIQILPCINMTLWIAIYRELPSFMKMSIPGDCILGAVSIRKTVLPGMAIPMLKIRRPNGRLIFNM